MSRPLNGQEKQSRSSDDDAAVAATDCTIVEGLRQDEEFQDVEAMTAANMAYIHDNNINNNASIVAVPQAKFDLLQKSQDLNDDDPHEEAATIKQGQRVLLQNVVNEKDVGSDEHRLHQANTSEAIKHDQMTLLRSNEGEGGEEESKEEEQVAAEQIPDYEIGIPIIYPGIATRDHGEPGAYQTVGLERRRMAKGRITEAPNECEATTEEPTSTSGTYGPDGHSATAARGATVPRDGGNTVFEARLVDDIHGNEETNDECQDPSASTRRSSNNNSNNNPRREHSAFDSNEVIQGESVKPEAHTCLTWVSHNPRVFSGIFILCLIIIVILILGLTGVFESNSGEKQNAAATTTYLQPNSNLTNIATKNKTIPLQQVSPTLERIERDGVVRFGYESVIPGNVLDFDEKGTAYGFFAEMGKAIALALNVEPEYILMPELQFNAIANGSADVLIRSRVHTMSDQIFQSEAMVGFDFTYPFSYIGIAAAGDPFFISNCLDNSFYHLGNCTALKVCIPNGLNGDSRIEGVMNKLLPTRNIVVRNTTFTDLLQGFMAGDCNVVVHHNRRGISEYNIRQMGFEGPYASASTTFLPEPLTFVTASTDPVFSDFVSSVIQTLHAADKYNITQSTADQFLQIEAFGEPYKDMFRRAVSGVGSFLDVQKRSFGPNVPIGTINQVNNGSTGLIFSHPFGTIQERRDTPLSPHMTSLRERSLLRCGIVLNRPGFAIKNTNSDGDTSHSGIDVDYCRAVATSLFYWVDVEDSLHLVELQNITEGYIMLALGDLDVLAGATWTVENDSREPTTGVGFAFTKPYFYGYSGVEDNFCLATRQEDHDFLSYVYWIVMATFYAEEQEINQTTSNFMPEVYVYGDQYHRMLRDCILSVGSYAQIYERNLETLIPRGDRNSLNANPNQGPQHYIIPGFV